MDLLRSRRNLFLDREELSRLQFKRFRRLLSFAYLNVPFYNRKLRRAGLKPDDVRSIEDVKKIPLTTKKELRETSLTELVAPGLNLARCVRNFTSGSTGEPLLTVAGVRTNSFDGSMWLRAYLLNGMRLRDKMVVIKDLSAHPEQYRSWLEYLGLMRRRYVSVFCDSRRLLNYFILEKPDVIQGYPSSFAIMASFYESFVKVKPRLIFTLGEFLDKTDRALITDVFGTDVYDYYGSSEVGLISWECKCHSSFHINADNVFLEFVGKDEEVIGVGELGEVVCTNLYNYEMPLIRFRQGDVGAAVSGECSCGIRLPLMEIKGGKKDDFLLAAEGRLVPPTVFFPYPFENFERIRRFRVIQERRNKLLIQLVLSKPVDLSFLARATENIERVFGQDMEVEFEFLEKLDRDPSGKLRKVISLL